MSLAAIIQRRRQTLLQAWAANPLVQIQVESPATLPGLAFLDDAAAGAAVGAVGRRSPRNVAMVSRPGNPDANASCWVAAGYTGYQSAYIAFVNAAYGGRYAVSDLGGWNVDHMLNRARAPQDTTFVRIEAVDAVANQAWGRLFEKAASNPQFAANQIRKRRTMSWAVCAKLAGQMPPTGPNDAAGIARLAAFFQTIGLDAREAQAGLQSMLDFAYKFR
jgi:hypothetical protein